MSLFDQNPFRNLGMGGALGGLGQTFASNGTSHIYPSQNDIQQMLQAAQAAIASAQMGSGASQQSVTGPRIRTALPEEHIVAAAVGWRRWNVPLFVDELRSINGEKWPTYVRLEAHCKATICAGAMCGCGIYAYKSQELVKKRGDDGNGHFVEGEVWLWGRILECSEGFRAQFAYPKAFVDNGSMTQRLAIVYGAKLIPSEVR